MLSEVTCVNVGRYSCQNSVGCFYKVCCEIPSVSPTALPACNEVPSIDCYGVPVLACYEVLLASSCGVPSAYCDMTLGIFLCSSMYQG